MSIKDVCLAVFVAFIWGSYFIVSKLALLSFPPLLLGFLRFFLVFLVTLPFFFKAKLPLNKLICLSIITFINILLVNYAIHLSEKLAPIIFISELVVPFSVLLGIYFFKEKLALKDGVGILIALIGSSIIIQMRSVEHVSILAVNLAITSSVLFACYNLIAKQLAHYNILTLLSQLSLLVALQFLLFSFFQEKWPNIKDIELQSFLALSYIVIICTLVGHYIWLYLLNKYSMSKVVPFTLLSPVFGCIITVIILNEHVKMSLLAGGLLVMLGIIIIHYKKAL